MRNIDLAYTKGKENTDKDGKTVYKLDDLYQVFQNVCNTPAYHRKGRYEMYSRLDNYGPFNVFFTVSCADYRWQENLTAVLREKGIGVRCNVNVDDQTEEYEVFTEDYGWIPMEVYKEEIMDETLHEVVRRNVVTATRNYQQRVNALMKNIILHPSNPLSVKHN